MLINAGDPFAMDPLNEFEKKHVVKPQHFG